MTVYTITYEAMKKTITENYKNKKDCAYRVKQLILNGIDIITYANFKLY